MNKFIVVTRSDIASYTGYLVEIVSPDHGVIRAEGKETDLRRVADALNEKEEGR